MYWKTKKNQKYIQKIHKRKEPERIGALKSWVRGYFLYYFWRSSTPIIVINGAQNAITSCGDDRPCAAACGGREGFPSCDFRQPSCSRISLVPYETCQAAFSFFLSLFFRTFRPAFLPERGLKPIFIRALERRVLWEPCDIRNFPSPLSPQWGGDVPTSFRRFDYYITRILFVK